MLCFYSALGTVRWGAPETFDYPALWTDKADIYSLGMTFWEIASRKVPFEDVSPPRFTICMLRPSPTSVLLILICVHGRCPAMRESSMLYKLLDGAQRYLSTVLKYPSSTSWVLISSAFFSFLFLILLFLLPCRPYPFPSLYCYFFFHCRKEFAAIISECWRDDTRQRPSSLQLLEKLEVAIELFTSSTLASIPATIATLSASGPINHSINYTSTNLTTSYSSTIPSTTSSTPTNATAAHRISSPTTISSTSASASASTHPTSPLDTAGVIVSSSFPLLSLSCSSSLFLSSPALLVYLRYVLQR